jgi:hypothetical protein
MKKRAVSAFLWFYAGWFVGSAVAFAAGLSPLLAPILGIGAGAFVGRDPLGIIWTSPTASSTELGNRAPQVQNLA